MITPKMILLLNAFSTWFLVGLIWIVQIVHYPLFSGVGAELYEEYQRQHQKLITFVVAPPMLLEVATTVMLLYWMPKQLDLTSVWIGVGLVIVIWLSTAFLQIPCHAKLETGFDENAHRFLVNSNWIRTIAWTLRGVLVGWMIWNVVQAEG